jgi:arabinofuranan 3-O-arabinosyltransferase
VRRCSSRDPAVLAGLFVVWAVAWSVTPGRISEDTKNDLYVDPWGFLAGALHLWDAQVTWGGLQNQAYGYLFPMGPFFGIGSQFLPMWVVQRLWWMTLLTAGFVAVLGLLRSLDIGTPRVRIVAAVAYVLAPRVLSTIGALSSEAQPQLLAPAILWPLVLVDRGRLTARRGAALSGLAIVCCGGVNATATAFAVLPSAIWLLTRQGWWRRPVTWVWGAAVVSASSWWVAPLLVLGQHSPPFLDWIENAHTVSSQITLLDVFRGTTAWLGHLVTSSGEWWPAGYQLVSSRTSIVVTTAVMALGLAGLSMPRLPHRAFLTTCLVLGVLVISLPHEGTMGSPAVHAVQNALDGALAPLRNVHKADLLLRLPLVIGLAHLLSRVTEWRPRREWLRGAVVTTAVLLDVGAAAPGFGGAIAPRGSFVEMAPHWRDLGKWLDAQHDGRSLIVPAANFGEYVWGRTMDEPLRPLTHSAYAVRDAVPLAPAGTIRLLDEVETRLQTGRPLGGATTMLRQAGTTHLVLRNDLSSDAGQPPVELARSALLNTPDVTFTKGFGKTWVDATGERVHPIEVYTLTGPVAPELGLWDARDVVGATGASEDLARLEEAGLDGRPVVFDGDRSRYLVPSSTVVTDGFRARDRYFGAPRGQDVTSGLDAAAAKEARDYLPWPEVDRRSLTHYDGILALTASSSIAEDYSVAGLQPAHRPYAALDNSPLTAWATMWDPSPELEVELEKPTDLRVVTLRPYANDVRFGKALGVAKDITVTTDNGSVDVELADSGEATAVALPPGATTRVGVRIRSTSRGATDAVVTGLSDLELPGVRVTEVVTTPHPVSDGASSAVLGAGLPGRDGCSVIAREFTCFAGLLVDPESTGAMVRDVSGLAPGVRKLSGTLAVDPLNPPAELLEVPGVRVSASSQRGYAPAGLPAGIVDSDKRTAWSPSVGDESPSVTLTLDTPVAIEGIRIQARRDWAKKAAPAVLIDVDGQETTRRLPAHGVLTIPATTGRKLTLTFLGVPGKSRAGIAALELEEVELIGHPFAPPPTQLQAPCGSGPSVTVDGQSVPTTVSGPRSALFGLDDFSWRSCRPVTLTDAESHRVTVAPWRSLAPRSADIAPTSTSSGTVAPAGVAVDVESPAVRRAHLPPGVERVLVMADNANDGWVARLGGTELRPQVFDGRRQGFVVPAGMSGELTIEFAPDRPYRWALLVGALLVGALVLLAVWPSGGSPRSSLVAPRRDVMLRGLPRPHRTMQLVGAVFISGLIAGPVGFLVGLLTGGLAVLGRIPWRVRLCAVVALPLAAAATQAWFAPGRVGGSGVEGAVRLLLLTAGVLALTGHESRDQARGRYLDPVVADRSQQERHRDADGQERSHAAREDGDAGH